MMMNGNYSYFYKTLRFLKKNLPFQHSVYIRRIKLRENHDGDCMFRGEKFWIRIEKGLPEYYAIEVLLHEMAHVLAWGKDKNNVHGENWGKAYSQVYRKFLEFIEE